MNPYDAPRTLAQTSSALPPWTAPSLRAGLVVIALDFARGTAWRLLSTVPGLFVEHFNPNVLVQLGFAVENKIINASTLLGSGTKVESSTATANRPKAPNVIRYSERRVSHLVTG